MHPVKINDYKQKFLTIIIIIIIIRKTTKKKPHIPKIKIKIKNHRQNNKDLRAHLASRRPRACSKRVRARLQIADCRSSSPLIGPLATALCGCGGEGREEKEIDHEKPLYY